MFSNHNGNGKKERGKERQKERGGIMEKVKNALLNNSVESRLGIILN